MYENVTNKTPKRRRWIARLLVSALCILLASSLLFVGVVAENIELVAQFSGNYGFATSPYNNYVYPFGSNLLVYSNSYMVYLQVGSSVKSVFDIRSSEGYDSTYLSDNLSFYYDGVFLYGLTTRKTSTDLLVSFYTFTIVDNEIISASAVNVSTYVSGTHYSSFTTFVVVDGNVYSFYLYGSSSTTTLRYLAFLKLSGTDLTYYYYANIGSGLNSYYNSASFQNGNLILGLYKNSRCYFFNIFSNSFSYVEPPSSSTTGQNYVFDYEGDTYYINSNVLCKWNIDTVSFERVGSGVSGYYFSSNNGVLNSYSLPSSMSISYTVYTGLPTNEPPPDSSDETTESPPPESSEPDEPGTLNIYRTDIDRSGGVMVFNSTLDISIPSDGLESLSAYLGYYWDVDSSVQPPPSYMYLWASYEDGTRQRYDFDFSAYGYALGSDFAQNFYYPDYLGMEFEIPLNGETDIYFVTSSPGGSVTVENSDGRIITLNFGSTSSYARIDFVDELNYRITLYNNDMAIGNSLTFDQGVYRYLFVYNVDSVVNTWYYPEPGTSTLINYDKVENGLYNVVLTLNDKIPDYGKPGDFEDAVSRYEEIEGAVSSTMSETWEYLESLQEELNGSFDIVEFSEANAKLDQILSTPGGDTIFTFFKSLWGINPLLPTFAVMTVCFAGVAFIIRKI